MCFVLLSIKKRMQKAICAKYDKSLSTYLFPLQKQANKCRKAALLHTLTSIGFIYTKSKNIIDFKQRSRWKILNTRLTSIVLTCLFCTMENTATYVNLFVIAQIFTITNLGITVNFCLFTNLYMTAN
ncbi:hypothetical protein O9A_01247 [Bartonella koehlerae C-29]|uniref:Uncharacterized protein n=1 Tax=Bartonella koehlerae C-29 TaxID=1134510 RepID=A0A067WCV7_9HYPH|nr:hypothetical protein O9A_01247 [Bartonella koehlerae C-29]